MPAPFAPQLNCGGGVSLTAAPSVWRAIQDCISKAVASQTQRHRHAAGQVVQQYLDISLVQTEDLATAQLNVKQSTLVSVGCAF